MIIVIIHFLEMPVFVLMTVRNRVMENLPKTVSIKEAYLSVVFARTLSFVMNAGDFTYMKTFFVHFSDFAAPF